MNRLMSNLPDALRILRSIGWSDVLDIILVASLIFLMIRFIRRTNAKKVANGILLLVLATWISSALNLMVTSFILRQVFSIGILAVIVLFQPEIRRLLEQAGNTATLKSMFASRENRQMTEVAIAQTVLACIDMAKTKTGALIVFERNNDLDGYCKTGTLVNAEPAAELIKNIFFPNTPLHDGAMLVKNGRIHSAASMLPLSDNVNLSRELGMRHRAGIGISERTDAVVVIVSEESGAISVAVGGMLKRHLAPDTFEKILRNELLPKEEPKKNGLKKLFDKGGKKDAK